MKPITDPALLQQLEAGAVPAPAGLRPITDPDLLSQLEGGPSISGPAPLKPTVAMPVLDPLGINNGPATRTSVLEDFPIDPAIADAARRVLPKGPRQTQPSRRQQFVSEAPPVDQGFVENAARVGRRILGGINESTAGIVRNAAEIAGADTVADFAAASAEAGNRFANRTVAPRVQVEGFAPGSIVQELPAAAELAGVSIGQQLPAMAAGGSIQGVLGLLGLQSYGQQFQQGREAGLGTGAAMARAAPMAGLEVAGERFGGLPDQLFGLQQLARGAGVEEGFRRLIAGGLKEIPGETGITYTGQFLVDKLPGIGINPDATVDDFIEGARQTALVAALQGQGMTTAGAGVAAVREAFNRLNPQQQLAAAARLMAEIERQAPPSAQPPAAAPTQLENEIPAAPAPQPQPPAAPPAPVASAAPEIRAILDALNAAAPGVVQPPAEPPAAPAPAGLQPVSDPALIEQLETAAPAPAPAPVATGADVVAASLASQEIPAPESPAPAGGLQPPAEAPIAAPAPASQAAATISSDASPTSTRVLLGRDSVPMTDGGRPFKTAAEARRYKGRRFPELRILGLAKVPGEKRKGFVLVEATPAQLRAQAQAAKRIAGAQAGEAGKPLSAHEFLIRRGGLARDAMAEVGMDRNPRMGNRYLFAAAGKGMSLAKAAEALREAGYTADESENAAAELIRRSLKTPQYTPEGWERIAQAEQDAQFEDYLADTQEQADEGGDPFMLDEADMQALASAAGTTDVGLRAEVEALLAMAETQGIDTDTIREDAARSTENQPEEAYLENVRREVLTALEGRNESRSGQPPDQDGGQQPQEAQPAGSDGRGRDPGQPGEPQGLTTYDAAELERRDEEQRQAEQRQARADREAEQRAAADRERDEFTLTGSDRPADVAMAAGQSGLFDAPSASDRNAAAPQPDATANIEETGKGPLPIPADLFADAIAEARGNSEADLFAEPARTVRIEDAALREGLIELDEAKARIEQWKANAKKQGADRVNQGRVVLSLFDTSGEWSKPWREAGYEVLQFDIQDGTDINDFSVEYLTEQLGLDRADVILAAPPCTDFASSGAQYWKGKDADGRTEASVELVRQTLRTVELFKPAVWAMENPVGRIAKVANLPKPTLTFQPSNFGDPYTKRTLLWGSMSTDMPLAPVDPKEGSRIVKLSGTDKFGRSLTPEGFAYAFFQANNLHDKGEAGALAAEYRGIPADVIQAALDAGATASEVENALQDQFYDGDIEGAIASVRALAPTTPPPRKREGKMARQAREREQRRAEQEAARDELENAPQDEIDAYLESLPLDKLNTLAARLGVEPNAQYRAMTEAAIERAQPDVAKLRQLGGATPAELVVNNQPRDPDTAPEECLLLMPCGGQKLKSKARADALYTGPMWQTLRTRGQGLPQPQLAILSAKHGVVAPSTELDPYDERMTDERASQLERDVKRQADAVVAALRDGPRPLRDVQIVGGAEYRRVMVAIVAELQRRGVVDKAASVRETRGGIGEQRAQLGAYVGTFDQSAPIEAREAAPAYASTDGFKAFADGAKLVPMRLGATFKDGEAVVVEALHGTTGDFDTFDLTMGNPESDLGAGVYFTNNPADVANNYAGMGPDLTAKIERDAERIANEEDIENDEALQRARAKYMANQGATMPVVVRFNNPAVIGGPRPTFLDYTEEYNEELDEYAEPTGKLPDLIDALRSVAPDFEEVNIEQAIADLFSNGIDGGMTVEQAIETIKASEGTAYAMDENGNLAQGELIRRAFEVAGFDGFIDHTVDQKFGSQRRIGQKMAGMQPGTVHFIAFKPEQIKSRIGNRGTFDPRDPNILREPDEPLDWEQFKLFSDYPTTPEQQGAEPGKPGVQRAKRAAAMAAVKLQAQPGELSRRLANDLKIKRTTSLVGQRVQTPEDLATLAQVYRDPRFETFRVFFTDDSGRVVGQAGLSNRMPGATSTIIGERTDEFLAELTKRARDLGATGFWMMHNHPSGKASPSQADINVTRQFTEYAKSSGVVNRGHVVIDTNQYSRIEPNGQYELVYQNFGATPPENIRQWGDTMITSASQAADFLKGQLQDNDAVVFAVLDSQMVVRNLVQANAKVLSSATEAELMRELRRQSMAAGGSRLIAITRGDTIPVQLVDKLRNVLMDFIRISPDGRATHLAAMGVVGDTGKLFPERDTRVTTDTSPEFAYLRDMARDENARRRAKKAATPWAQEAGQTDTPAFRSWFGDSKVVDGQGRPMVVYHGAPDARFASADGVFRSTRNRLGMTDDTAGAYWFAASRRVAASYADDRRAFDYQNAEPGIVAAYLKLENPLVVDGRGQHWRDAQKRGKTSDVIEEARAAGHDGVIIRNVRDDYSSLDKPRKGEATDTFVVFQPTQIKSADRNSGAFDPSNPSMLAEPAPQLQPDAPPPRTSWNPFGRDKAGRVKFRLGELALDKLDAMTLPIQNRFQMRMASPELRAQLRRMKGTIEEANRKAADVAKAMSTMSEADRAMVSDIVEGMLAPGVIPPEHAARVADAITKTMDRQTDELVELGMLSKETAERWRGKYLPRIYNRKTELEDDPLLHRLFKTGMPAGRGIGGGSLKGRGLFQEVSIDAVPQWLEMGFEVRDNTYEFKNNRLQLRDPNAPKPATDKVVVWRDWTPSERAQMGENRDAMLRYVQGYTNMQRDLAIGRLFREIASNPENVRRSASAGFVRVPDSDIPETGGVKRYGALAGLYVREDIMAHLSRFEEAANDTLQLWREALGLWKEGKTALNPVAHFNNIISNVSMAHFAGVSYWDVHKYVAAARDLLNTAPGIVEAREAGLFTGSFTKEELMQALPAELRELMELEESQLRKQGRRFYNALTLWLRTPLRNAYEFEDVFFKYVIYRDARAQGMEPGEATDYALRYIFTYDDLPRGARIVRDTMIPFFSWTYKAIPALLHTAMVYPWRLAAPATVLHGINAVAYAMAAGDEDDDWLEALRKGRELEAAEREVLPDFRQGMSALGNPKNIRLGTDELTGHPIYLDVSRVVPGGDLFDMENQAGGLPLPAPLMPNHPVLSAFAAMVVNKEMFMGREVVDRNDTATEKLEKRAKWMAGFLLPAVAPGGYHSQRVLDAAAYAMGQPIRTPLGEFTGIDKSGQPVQPKYAAMQTVGIKARPTDLELEEARKRSGDQALIRSITAEVRSLARLHQRGAISTETMDRERERAREKINRIREGERP